VESRNLRWGFWRDCSPNAGKGTRTGGFYGVEWKKEEHLTTEKVFKIDCSQQGSEPSIHTMSANTQSVQMILTTAASARRGNTPRTTTMGKGTASVCIYRST
jgi:hypothetical protein